jgi:disulfide bond formation protein DsbB
MKHKIYSGNTEMKLPSTRLTYFLGAIAIAMLVTTAMYLQTHDGITPCPLCILQRFVFMVLGSVFLLASLFKLRRFANIFFSILSFLIASFGAFLAGRQVWLQHLPPSNSDCGASLEYMLQAFPLKMVLQRVFSGSAECSFVDWRFMGLSLAGWSLVCFSFFVLLSIRQFCCGLSNRC